MVLDMIRTAAWSAGTLDAYALPELRCDLCVNELTVRAPMNLRVQIASHPDQRSAQELGKSELKCPMPGR